MIKKITINQRIKLLEAKTDYLEAGINKTWKELEQRTNLLAKSIINLSKNKHLQTKAIIAINNKIEEHKKYCYNYINTKTKEEEKTCNFCGDNIKGKSHKKTCKQKGRKK